MSTKILTTTEGNDQFYPTPPSVAGKMLSGIDFRMLRDVLEPSCGKGDLALALASAYYDRCGYNFSLHIDCCEIDPYLRQICKYNFSDEKKREIYAEYEGLDHKSFNSLTDEQKVTFKKLKRQHDILGHTELFIVNDDFFTYHTHKHYQLILMNPPFENGDLHLLRALEMQKNGGKVICLLNAETLRNPYSSTRKLLLKKLQALDADIEYIDDAFSTDAERKADVDVAIVRVDIPEPEFDSTIYERMKEAMDKDIEPDPEIHALVSGDYIEQAVQMYKVEVDATMEFVKEYMALIPYMQRSLGDELYGKDPILTLVVDRDSAYSCFDYSKYMRLVRMKYWRALFTNKQFIGKLTSELREKYNSQVENMANYEFSIFNIKQVLVDMNASMCSGVEKAIMDLFEKLTVEHSWYPECSQNRHYFNGWKTNTAHKIGKKCIIPTYGMFSSYSWRNETFDVSTAYKTISDIEKAFDYLDGGKTDSFDLDTQLKIANASGKTRNIPCKYFSIDLFKKGTTHIKFYPEAMTLVERLNIYASQKKAWLPPNYGKTKYADLGDEEKTTIDSFHGDGTPGSGEKEYTEVLAQADFYLSEPTRAVAALAAPAG